MKGDIKLELKINKKIGLFLLGGMSLFAAADFVSMVDLKSSGGVTIEEGLTEEEVVEIVLNTMPIGSITLRLDGSNPSEIYGGVWELVNEDATFGFGNGSDYSSSSIVGDNTPLVPLKDHTHTFTGDLLPEHRHSLGSTSDGYHGGTSRLATGVDTSGGTKYTQNVSSGTPTGTISNEGTSNAKIDVRGARLLVNVWKRIG